MAKKRRKSRYRFWRSDGRGIIYTWRVGEAADRLGLTVEAARARLRKGALKGYKVDGQWYVVVYHPYRHRRLKRRRLAWQRWN